MNRFLPLWALLMFFGLGRFSARAQGAADGLPARPAPFQFVNDQASVLAPADAKKLESGLRHYAEQTGTQVVVVTVPTLGGRTAADYGRALGTAWGVGQRNKNNGIVVLVAPQEHKVAIEAGSGLQDKVTAAVKQRVIGQDFGPSFKQGNYFGGLRKGLSALMLAANPNSNPRKSAAGTAAAGAGSASGMGGAALNTDANSPAAMPAQEPMSSPRPAPVVPAAPSGPGMGTLLLGALGIGAVLFFLMRMFRRSSASNTSPAGNAPVFNPNQPNQPPRPGGTPNFMPGQPQGGNNGPGYNNGPGMMGGSGGSGPGIGGMLATGAAAAAGAYLGNRMAGGGHETMGNGLDGQQTAGLGGVGNAGAAGVGGAGLGAGAVAGDDYFSNRDGAAAADNQAPDYFSNDNMAADAGSGDYFSGADDSGSSSADDTSSADTGGGGFDGGGGGDDSGSW